MKQNINDPVNHPNHYCAGGIECIDAIAAALACHTDPMSAWLTGQCLKYLWRWPLKNGIEDLRKTEFYLRRLIAAVESQGGGAAKAAETGETETVETEAPAEAGEALKTEAPRTLWDVAAERWPTMVSPKFKGGIAGCPPEYFKGVVDKCRGNCEECWSRPMREEYTLRENVEL